jgi:hypothetical protein
MMRIPGHCVGLPTLRQGVSALALLCVTMLAAGCGGGSSPNRPSTTEVPAATLTEPAGSSTTRLTPSSPVPTGARTPTAEQSTPSPRTTSAASPATWRYRTYTNARFRFSLQVPAAFIAQTPPEDGDGLGFESPDHRG